MMFMSKKCIILGMDGMSLYFYRKFNVEGFSKIRDETTWGNLKSNIPPVTIPAWTSILTGKSPGKLGISDFFKINKNYSRVSLDLTKMFFRDYLPNVLGGSLKMILISYPGIDSITTEATKKYNLNNISFKDHMPDFVPILLKIYRSSKRIEISKEEFKKQKNIFLDILKKKKWDIVFPVFGLTDRIIHDGNNRDFPVVYRLIDEFVFDLIKLCKEKRWNLIIVSDHGARKVNKKFNITRWLIDSSFLKVKKDKKFLMGAIDWLSNYNSGLVRTMSAVIERINKSLTHKSKSITGQEMILGNIDWRKTKVFAVSTALTNFMPLYINIKDKFEKGIVNPGKDYEMLRNEIKKKLLKLRDPKTEKRVVKKVWFKEELYKGDKLNYMPDLIVEAHDDCLIDYRFFPKIVVKQNRFIHDLYGTFMAYGPDFKEGYEVKGAEIIDIAPTVLHLFGLPVPKDMDGNVLKDIFRPGSEPAKRKVKYCEPLKRKDVKEKTLSEKEHKKIKERLKALGYYV